MAAEKRKQVSRRKAVAILGSGIVGTAMGRVVRAGGGDSDAFQAMKAPAKKAPARAGAQPADQSICAEAIPRVIDGKRRRLHVSACCFDLTQLLAGGFNALPKGSTRDHLTKFNDALGVQPFSEHGTIVLGLNRKELEDIEAKISAVLAMK